MFLFSFSSLSLSLSLSLTGRRASFLLLIGQIIVPVTRVYRGIFALLLWRIECAIQKDILAMDCL